MSVYKYIVESNPDASYEVCKKYGFFRIADLDEMANSLQEIVAQGGEDSFKDVMDLHPDKDVILELFQKKSDLNAPHTKQDCGCRNSSFQNRRRLANAAGPNVANQTGTYIMIGALLVSLAIISSIK